MNDRKFSVRAEQVLRCAQAAAGELGHGYVGCEHLLLAMLREEGDAACRALNASGVYEKAMREKMIEKLGRGTAEKSTVQGLTPHARSAVETGLPPIQADQLGPVEHIRITRNGQLLFEGGYTAEHDMGWYDLEGNWDPFTMSVSYSSTAGDDYWEHYETDRGTILSFARGPQLVSRGSWELYFAMLLLSALLALDAAFPLVIFHWQHMCDVKDPEPSDFYLGMQRAGWCVYPFLILIGYIIALRVLP